MSTDIHDLRSTIIPKSDQLNADQLLGGPLVITVTDVRVGSGADQPVSVFHNTDPARPFKPCLTMRKVLVLAWGADGTQWIGRSMELYHDPAVKFGGELVGGIRISRLTDIAKDIKVSLAVAKGRKNLYEIGPLKLSGPLQEVLAEIAAATGRDSLKKARAKAEALKSPADMELAVAAYKKRVEALKERAAAAAGAQAGAPAAAAIAPADRPDTGAEASASAPAAALTYAQLAERMTKAGDRTVGEIILDDAREVLPADQLTDLQNVFNSKFPEAE